MLMPEGASPLVVFPSRSVIAFAAPQCLIEIKTFPSAEMAMGRLLTYDY
jgi:hypothetical protein